MLRWVAIAYLVVGFEFALVRLASGALILDQIHDVQAQQIPDGFGYGVGATGWQSFTVGISGRLTRIDLGVFSHYLPNDPLTVLITHLQNGSPDLSAT